jgi:hypothetical protein
MDHLQQCTDLRRPESDPELFAIVPALGHIRTLIHHDRSDMRRPDDDSALHPHYLEAFLARAVERTWKDMRIVQEWRRFQWFLPRLKEAWESGKTLFQEDFDQTKGKEYIEYFSIIDFAIDGYAYLSASRVYPDNHATRDWAINGDMLMWRWHFLKKERSARKGVYDDILL